jgi:hypothetical protein
MLKGISHTLLMSGGLVSTMFKLDLKRTRGDNDWPSLHGVQRLNVTAGRWAAALRGSRAYTKAQGGIVLGAGLTCLEAAAHCLTSSLPVSTSGAPKASATAYSCKVDSLAEASRRCVHAVPAVRIALAAAEAAAEAAAAALVAATCIVKCQLFSRAGVCPHSM